MSASTIAYLDKNTKIDFIYEFIKENFDDGSTIRKEDINKNLQLGFIMFNYKQCKYAIYYSADKELRLDMNFYKDSVEIIKTILETFGGWIEENDCNESDKNNKYYISYNRSSYNKYRDLAKENKKILAYNKFKHLCNEMKMDMNDMLNLVVERNKKEK